MGVKINELAKKTNSTPVSMVNGNGTEVQEMFCHDYVDCYGINGFKKLGKKNRTIFRMALYSIMPKINQRELEMKTNKHKTRSSVVPYAVLWISQKLDPFHI